MIFTFYPEEDVLRQLITIEENQIFRRLEVIASGNADPGRPTYEESYGSFPVISRYKVSFSSVLCTISLILRHSFLFSLSVWFFFIATFLLFNPTPGWVKRL